MVFTRNQKRKLDLLNMDQTETYNNESNIQLHNNTNIILCKTKKRPKTSENSETISTLEENTNEEEISSNISEDEDIIEDINEDEDIIEDIIEDINEDEDIETLETDNNITKNIQDIITNSVNRFIKKFKPYDTDEENINEKGDEYDKFIDYIDSIKDGEFFERTSIDNKKKSLKKICDREEIKRLNEQLKNIHKEYKDNAPSVIDILNMDIDITQKKNLLEKIYHLNNSELLTLDYSSNLKILNTNIKGYSDPELHNIEKEILKTSNNLEYSDNYKEKILKSKMPFENKVIAYKRLEVMEAFESNDTSEYAKYKSWMDILLSIPYDERVVNNLDINNIDRLKSYIKNVRDVLDKRLSFLEKPKDQIINVVTQMIKNPNYTTTAIGLYGNKGLGKCHAINTPILMFNGSIKMVQDIKVGEFLMGDDSTPRKVLSLASGREEMYKIEHLSQKKSYIVNKSHILTLKYNDKKRLYNNNSKGCFIVSWFDHIAVKICSKTFNYKDKDYQKTYNKAKDFFNRINETNIVDISLEKYLDLDKKHQRLLCGFTQKVIFSNKEVPVSPYIIGLWLSNNMDAKLKNPLIYYKYNKILLQLKIDIKADVIDDYNIFKQTLHKYDLLKYKYIPDLYKINSEEKRLELLAGLIDGCGRANKEENCYQLKINSKKLSQDILYLCDSLGICCYINKTKLIIENNRIIPIMTDSVSLRKIKQNYLSEIKVTSLGVDDYYGFELGDNHRYLLGNFIVTHNTALVKSISEALDRPYRTINLGGESDSSLLTGHGFTYVGSCPGRIIEILRETKCTNPIILFDELDKVSETHHGKEIIGNLIHLTDTTSNNKYNYDKYFAGLDFDLSNVLFIFTYNDSTKVDKILADRLFKIKIENYTYEEKLEIAKTHIIKTVLDQYKFSEDEILFGQDTINYIVESSKSDQGMRDIKRKFEIIVSRINTLLLTDKNENIIRLKYKSLYDYYQCLPVKVLKEHVDILLSESISNDEEDKFSVPPPGMYM